MDMGLILDPDPSETDPSGHLPSIASAVLPPGSPLSLLFPEIPYPIALANYGEGGDMSGRGVISDKWSRRILWACAIGTAIGLYMVSQERQLQNREKMLAEALKDVESASAGGGDEV